MVLIHSYLRWLILALYIVVIIKHFIAYQQQKSFDNTHRILGLSLTISLDVMLLIGIYLYVTSPWGYALFQQPDVHVMKDSALRKIAVEHPFSMVVAIALAHIASAQRKKNINDGAKHKKMFFLYLLSFVLILIGIPWGR